MSELSNNEITEDFCETFKTKEDCIGAMTRIIATGHLPEGVNPNDDRVKSIVKWCNENKSAV